MLNRSCKTDAVLLLVASLLGGVSANAQSEGEYSVKIPAAHVVNVLAPPANAVPEYDTSSRPDDSTIQPVQATGPSAPALLPPSGFVQSPPTPTRFPQDTLAGRPLMEGGPALVGPSISADPNVGTMVTSPQTTAPTTMTGPVVFDNAATIIPTGCPTCAFVVCQCPTRPSKTPIGNICGASCCCPNWWFRKDLLAWVVKKDHVPPLVTTSPNGWPASDAGVLGQPNTSTLFDDEAFDGGVRLGGRLVGGFWFDACRKRGIQLEFWGLGRVDEDYYVESDGDPVLARPFFNTDIGAQDAQIVAYPGLARGSIHVDIDGKMYSAAPLWRFNTKWCKKCRFGKEVNHRFDFLAGYRYWHFDEDLAITERLEPMGAFYAPGTALTLTDGIDTRNDFHGAEFGIEWLRQRGKWVWEFNGSIASGRIFQRIQGNGTTVASVPGVLEQTVDGGFYVPAGGIDVRNDRGTIIPQARIGLGYYLRPCLRLHVGYDFVYVKDVVRPSGALNPVFPGSRLASGGVPGDGFAGYEETDIWAQGVTLGMTMNY